MSDRRSTDDPDDASGQDNATWSPNGTNAEATAAESPADAMPGEAAATAEAAPEAAADAEAEAAPDAAAEAVSDAAPADDGSAFLGELVRAMQTTAAAERARIAEDTDRRREAHLATIQARREAEAASMRELADADLQAIDAWAEEERQRIQAERERRATALQADLETSLADHGARIDREVESVEAAIATYRADVDAFFAALDHETDPVAIAQHAGRRPAFPALDSISAEAAASADAAAAAEPAIATDGAAATEATEASAPGETATPAVGVMDAGFAPKLADAWAAWSGLPVTTEAGADAAATDEAASDEPVQATAEEAPGQDSPGPDGSGPESLEVVAVTSAAARPASAGLLQSTPVNRPMSWLRRAAGGDHNNDET